MSRRRQKPPRRIQIPIQELNAMPAADWARGVRIEPGERFD